jgi:hypothetical protein
MTLEAIVSCSLVGSAFVSSEQDLDQANIGILLEQVGGKLCRSTGRYALARLANLGDQCPKFGIEDQRRHAATAESDVVDGARSRHRSAME